MKQRIISAIIMAIILVPIILYGGIIFKILAVLLGLASVYELMRLKPNLPVIVKILTYLETIFIILCDFKFLKPYLYPVILISILLNLALLVFINNQDKYDYKDSFYLLGIILFIGIAFKNFIYLRNLNLKLIIYLFSITIITDSFALFTGKLFGKHKLAPLISPNKTIEGAIGGSIMGTIIASIIYILLFKVENILFVILLTLFLSLIGQLGDLIKSSIKRRENIKDFSNLIPGHGGIIDRFDSIIFVMLTYIVIRSFL